MKVALITVGYIVFPLVIIMLFSRYKWAKAAGTVILAYAVGIIPALFGLTHFEPDTLGWPAMLDCRTWLTLFCRPWNNTAQN